MTTTPEEFWRAHDHRFQAPGVPQDEERTRIQRRLGTELTRAGDRLGALVATDRAWTVMLHRQGLVTTEVAAEVLGALESGEGAGEDYLKRTLAGENPSAEDLEAAEDIAGVVNLGRTLQEPMSRLQQRGKLLDVLDLTIACLGVLLDQAEAHADTIMAGQTHLSHAQPTTYGAYLVAVHDAVARSLEQIELAYRHTNQNSAGCGACSGTGWPVDRNLITELLGLDTLVESTYDGEPGQDHALTILFAITNLGVILSRVAMDFNIWAMEEVMMVSVDPSWRGVSSLMPQKAIPGSEFERVRLEASDVIGQMMTGVVSNKGEPYSDMLPIYEGYRGALRAMCHIEKALGFFNGLVKTTTPDRERMLEYAREGFSATPDLSIVLIRDHGCGSRRAHRICATMVRIARERGIRPQEVTGELLDEAARIADETPPGLTSEVIREALDPARFIERHDNLGDPHPSETLRMAASRRQALAAVMGRQSLRKQRIESAAAKLSAEVAAICASHASDVKPNG